VCGRALPVCGMALHVCGMALHVCGMARHGCGIARHGCGTIPRTDETILYAYGTIPSVDEMALSRAAVVLGLFAAVPHPPNPSAFWNGLSCLSTKLLTDSIEGTAFYSSSNLVSNK
jgi:hypothetical protein